MEQLIPMSKRAARVEEYYFSRKLAEVRRLDQAGKRIINLGIGSPDLPPSTETIDALTKSAAQPGHHGYQSYKGIPALREAIAGFYQRIYGVTLDPETMLLPLMGSKEGIMHISMAFVNEGDTVLIPDPGYPTYASVAGLVGARIQTYRLDPACEWAIDMDDLRARDLSGVKLMWVNFPHMPTGTQATPQQLEELVALAAERGFLVVNDNPYSLILNDNPASILAVPGGMASALELNSLSKSHNMAGWRIGWVAGRPEYIDAVLRVKSNMDSGMFLGLQHAAIEALKAGPEWFTAQDAVYKGRRREAARILTLLGCRWSEAQSGLFLWAQAPDSEPDVEAWLDRILYGPGVFLTPGMIFGEAGKRYVRISLCSTEEKLREAADRISAWQNEKEQGG